MNMKKISEGAESIIYEGRLIGNSIIVKYRENKRYRVKDLDELVRKQRTKIEAKIQAFLYQEGLNVPPIAIVGKYWIAMGYIEGDNLGKTIVDLKNAGEDGNILVEAMKKAGEQLGLIHLHGIVHGDFTPANILIDKRGKIWVIDFGLAEFSKSEEERALDLLLMKRSVSRKQYDIFEKSYAKMLGNEAKEVIARMHKIERRGRYQTRTLVTS
ncbi:MAG: KEOPS complex kinase/ATPase Bud32 [Candidatus Micrarchaeia archaeon]